MSAARKRLAALEASAYRDGKRCPTCRDWPGIITGVADSDDGPVTWETDCPEQCGSCGWRPYQVIMVRPAAVAA